MKKITTLLTAIIGMALMNQVSATHITVEVPTAGQLSSLVQDANCDSITISGNLNGQYAQLNISEHSKNNRTRQ